MAIDSKMKRSSPPGLGPTAIHLEMLQRDPELVAGLAYQRSVLSGDQDAGNEVMQLALEQWPDKKTDWYCLQTYSEYILFSRLEFTLNPEYMSLFNGVNERLLRIIKEDRFSPSMKSFALIMRVKHLTDFAKYGANQHAAKAVVNICEETISNSGSMGDWLGFFYIHQIGCLEVLGRVQDAESKGDQLIRLGGAYGYYVATCRCHTAFKEDDWDTFFDLVILLYNSYIIEPAPLKCAAVSNLPLRMLEPPPLMPDEAGIIIENTGYMPHWHTHRLLQVGHMMAKSCTTYDRIRKACHIWSCLVLSPNVPSELFQLAGSELMKYHAIYPDDSMQWGPFPIALEKLEKISQQLDIEGVHDADS